MLAQGKALKGTKHRTKFGFVVVFTVIIENSMVYPCEISYTEITWIVIGIWVVSSSQG